MRNDGFLILPDSLGAMWADVQRAEPWRATLPADVFDSRCEVAAPWLFQPALPAAMRPNISLAEVTS